MKGDVLRDICIKSCKDMYTQMQILQESSESTERNVSTVVNDIEKKTKFDEYWEIKLKRKIKDIDGIGIRVVNENGNVIGDFGQDDVIFDDYDEYNMTVKAYVASEELEHELNNPDKKRIKIISDMKWLIKLTEDTYTDLGDRIGYPVNCPYFSKDDYVFPKTPKGGKPTDLQRKAVDTILNSRLSYVWGAPGTGKTQFVLATAIIAHIRKGHRVAILAPTNNSLEQVLKGVLDVLKCDDSDHEYIEPDEDILRLGTPTDSFYSAYKGVCEDKYVSKRIAQITKELDKLKMLELASAAEFLQNITDSIRKILLELSETDDQYLRDEKNNDLDAYIDSLKSVLGDEDSFRGLLWNVSHINIAEKIDRIEEQLIVTGKDILFSEKYKDLTTDEIQIERAKLIDERNENIEKDTNHRITKVKIMAMTPYIMMARRRTLFERGGIVDVDQIFIDEVGYSNLVQTLPVFMCGPPVAMLGDHMQLPPVCEIERKTFLKFLKDDRRDDYMRYGFMWGQSILQIESYLSRDIEQCISEYIAESEPTFNEIKKCDLIESHRFSDNLASILDACVYHNGIKGLGEKSLKLKCINVVDGKKRTDRSNPGEVEAIKKYLEKNKDKLGKFAILTPYKDQRYLLETNCEEFKDDIMTIHSSQGREWDTIIISICDDGDVQKPIPLHLTSSVAKGCGGLKVMNTAVSRAKDTIILVCNREYWKSMAKENDLLGKIVESAVEETI